MPVGPRINMQVISDGQADFLENQKKWIYRIAGAVGAVSTLGAGAAGFIYKYSGTENLSLANDLMDYVTYGLIGSVALALCNSTSKVIRSTNQNNNSTPKREKGELEEFLSPWCYAQTS